MFTCVSTVGLLSTLVVELDFNSVKRKLNSILYVQYVITVHGAPQVCRDKFVRGCARVDVQ